MIDITYCKFDISMIEILKKVVDMLQSQIIAIIQIPESHRRSRKDVVKMPKQ